MRKKIRLYDTNFIHHGEKSSLCSYPGNNFEPRKIEWIRGPGENIGVSVFTDNCLEDVVRDGADRKIAWLLEPRALVPTVYDLFDKLENEFDEVYTHDHHLLSLKGKYKSYMFGGTWSDRDSWSDLSDNTDRKKICLIASHKRYLPGHKLRHEIVERLAESKGIDVWGNGYRPFDDMGKLLSKYEYCIVVENIIDGDWVTEKILTPLVSGCRVFYWGSERIGELLGDDLIKSGLVRPFSSIDQLATLIDQFHGEDRFNLSDMAKNDNWDCTEDRVFGS